MQEDRFKPYSSYSNRKLLWHGTGVAVAAAILKDGLRIMPHSGGRVGKGIYFASEAGKSLGYSKFSRLVFALIIYLLPAAYVAMPANRSSSIQRMNFFLDLCSSMLPSNNSVAHKRKHL